MVSQAMFPGNVAACDTEQCVSIPGNPGQMATLPLQPVAVTTHHLPYIV